MCAWRLVAPAPRCCGEALSRVEPADIARKALGNCNLEQCTALKNVQKREGASRAHSTLCPAADTCDRRAPDLAVQRWLGVLPKWWRRPSAHHRLASRVVPKADCINSARCRGGLT